MPYKNLEVRDAEVGYGSQKLSVVGLSAMVHFYHLQTLKADHIFSFRFQILTKSVLAHYSKLSLTKETTYILNKAQKRTIN